MRQHHLVGLMPRSKGGTLRVQCINIWGCLGFHFVGVVIWLLGRYLIFGYLDRAVGSVKIGSFAGMLFAG